MANVLIADDDPDYRDTFRTGLTQLGHSVTCTESGQMALEVLRKGDFDIIFLDVMMPGGGAITFGHEIANEFRDIPIVVISGQSHLFDTRLFQEGFRRSSAVLRKTASLREINDTIRFVLS